MGCKSIFCQCSSASGMFSNLKQSLTTDGTNPILQSYEVRKQVGTAGTEMVWKIHDAMRISDKKLASVFIFEKKRADKLHKPRRRETVTEILRREVRHLEKMRHPKMLQIYHQIEECHETLAFATEPIMASLANLLGHTDRIPSPVPMDVKEFEFLEVEVKYGIRQITDALSYLHGIEQVLHGNVCPSSILITKRGAWKLSGLGFMVKIKDGKDLFPCQPWTTKLPKLAQPDLDYLAPEIQVEKNCTTLSDMFSLGMIVCSIYNHGLSLIACERNAAIYAKKIEQIDETFNEIAHRMPVPLVEPVEKMISRDVRYRPTAQLLSLLKYFGDPVVLSLEQVDVMDVRDLTHKKETYSNLMQTIPSLPKKVLYQHVFPVIREECKHQDTLMFALPPLLIMIDYSTPEDYASSLFPLLKAILCMPKPIQATVYILDKLEIILSKTQKDEIKTEILPVVFNTLDSNSIQGQEAALNCVSMIREYLEENVIKKMVLPRAKSLFHKSANVKIRMTALTCIDKLLDSLDKMLILDEVLPFLIDISCQDPDVVMAVIGIYKHMLSDKRFGLTHNLIASKVMPPLIPQTVNPGLSMEQFGGLMEVLREMLEHIDRQRRNKLKQEITAPSALVRGSIKMKPNMHDDRYMYTNIDEKLNRIKSGCYTSPSSPELIQRTQPTSPIPQRKNSSLASLGTSFEDKSGQPPPNVDALRRYSLVPPGLYTPAIGLIPDNEHDGTGERPRRPSTQSMGPLGVPGEEDVDRPRRPSTHSLGPVCAVQAGDQSRRTSRSGSIFGTLIQMNPPDPDRRPSFSSISESVIQFLSGNK